MEDDILIFILLAKKRQDCNEDEIKIPTAIFCIPWCLNDKGISNKNGEIVR